MARLDEPPTAPSSGMPLAEHAPPHAWRVFAIWSILTAAGIALVTFAPILPPKASWQAGVLDEAFMVMTYAAVPVAALVLAMVGYGVWSFRATDMSDGPPIHGNSGVQVVWIAVSTALCLGLAGYGVHGLTALRDAPAPSLVVRAQAQQYGYIFEYSNPRVQSRELYLPLGRTTRIQMTSKDVVHGFWSPEMRIKQDIVPGMVTTLDLTPTREGKFALECTQLCGVGHAFMQGNLIVLPTADFESWLQTQEQVPDATALPPLPSLHQ